MNIIFGKDNADTIDDRYVVLELDTFRVSNVPDPVTAYCVIDQMLLEEIPLVNHYRDLHKNLLKNYRARNWSFCIQALEHLRGRWRGEIDSFYDDLEQRVSRLQDQDPGQDWDGFIERDSGAEHSV